MSNGSEHIAEYQIGELVNWSGTSGYIAYINPDRLTFIIEYWRDDRRWQGIAHADDLARI